LKILISIISSKKFLESRLQYIFETWLRDVKNYVIISDHEDKTKNILKLNEDSNYESHIKKNFDSFDFFYKNYGNFDWYMNLDDDTFLNYKNLEQELKKYSLDDVFMLGHINKGTLPTKPNLNYCSGGAGYVFNNKTLKILKNINMTYNNSRYADANIGMFCEENRIKIINNVLFNPNTPEFFKFDREKIKNSITFHYIFKQKFYELYNLIKE
jgi:hypothetical protein